MKRCNYGCGRVQPDGWDNVDRLDLGQEFVLMDGCQCAVWRRSDDMHLVLNGYDCIVANHMLSDVGHHQLPKMLTDLRSILADGGVLRILVPDVVWAFESWERGKEDWFPQDERTGDLDAKFCTFVTWFGESKSVFTWGYLSKLLLSAGFDNVTTPLGVGQSRFDRPGMGITELDGDRTTSLIIEAVK